METQVFEKLYSIRDNFKNGSVGNYLKENIETNSKLSFVTAYFTIYAYEKLKNELDSIGELRLLFGEPKFLKNVSSTTNPKSYIIEDEQLIIPVEKRLQQKVIAKQCCDWIKDKVQIKSLKEPYFIHGKLYHIKKTSGTKDAVFGSSNFTVNGLGLSKKPNIELNLIVNDRRDLNDLERWFDVMWNNNMDEIEVEDVKDRVIKYIELLYKENSPEFVYYKTLYHIFEKFIDETDPSGLSDIKANLYDSKIWKTLFTFQQHGVRGAINKILKFNGCIIADSVGLGKTYEALAIIKYFEMLNYRVLVICPKKLKDNWTVYQAHKNNTLNPFQSDKFSYTLLYHTDLSREEGTSEADHIDLNNFNWGAYDLVVIDESHNFRNNKKGKRDEEGNIIRKSRYERLMQDIIISGKQTKVLLLSATPVNNELKDLRNQIMFITGDKDSAFTGEQEDGLGIESITELLKQSQTKFTYWAKARIKEEKTTRDLINDLDSAFFKLLDALTIARSRKHITKYYANEMQKIGGFPDHGPVLSIYPDIDTQKRFLSYDKINEKISKYKLVHFNPSAYVSKNYKSLYEEKVLKKSGPAAVKMFSQEARESYLIGMMKVNFMKRLESSIYSFRETLQRTTQRIENLQNRIERFNKFKDENPDIEIENIDVDAIEDDDLREAMEVGEKLTFKMNHLKLDEWNKAMQADKEQLYELILWARDVDPIRDAKLQELKKLIKSKVENPTTTKKGNENKKVLVFTAFADTAKYLYENLENWISSDLKVHVALVTGGNENKTTFKPKGFRENTEYNHILTNFSPVSKRRKDMNNMPGDEEGEIDILIATDCISEGQNLQDCDYLINYDIHWNPVRIIQRFGRIDRIGSINHKVQLVNFWPTKDLDNYIKLKTRVEARMALVDISGTNEDNLLNQEQIKDLVEEELKFRNKQLLRLQNEVLDMDELNEGGISFSNFSLDDFRIELLNYIEANKEILKAEPLGIYTCVPHTLESTLFNPDVAEVVQPGVIFCLKQIGDTSGNEKVNPLQPYFLVYVQDNGTVRYNFTHPKQILDIYRLLCTGKAEPLQELCDLFNTETNNGLEMGPYESLIKEAVKAITSTFKKRNLGMLTNSRSATIISNDKQADSINKFELITWLVLK
jgi:SNF2 family DNA or RNA helicase